MNVELNGKVVVVVNTGTAISEDPLLGFRLKGAKNGDKLKVFWSDNLGESGTIEGPWIFREAEPYSISKKPPEWAVFLRMAACLKAVFY